MPSKDFLALNPGFAAADMPGANRRPQELEHIEQVAFIRWATIYASQCTDLAYVYAIPNGGRRDKATAGKLKAEGVKAGYPDLGLDVASKGYHGWRCELKVRGGRVEPSQRAWHQRLWEQGYCVDVCWSWTDAAAAVCHYLDLNAKEFGL